MSVSPSVQLGFPALPASRGHGACMEARSALAQGRHADALGAVRRARRVRGGAEAPVLALAECDALFGLLRYREAIGVLDRALERRPGDPDLEARLRIQRGHALWRTGKVEGGRAELGRAERRAVARETAGRLHEGLALVSWKAQELEDARRHLAAATRAYETAGSRLGLARTLETEAGMLRDAGQLREALRLTERRLEIVSAEGRRAAAGLALADRGALYTVMGRWYEARMDLDAAGRTLGDIGDPRAATVVEVNRAALDLARGELGCARTALARARAAHTAEVTDPRGLAEALLLGSDLGLAGGDHETAERLGAEALGLFALAKDRAGESRGRVRRAHALVGLGRVAEAVKEGRRAVEAGIGNGLALAHLAHGRALLRARPDEADAAFRDVLALSAERPELAHAARVGRALVRRAGHQDEEVRTALNELEAWADRRLLSYCLADIRTLAWEASSTRPPSPATGDGRGDGRDGVAALSEAALALAQPGEFPARWAAAMRCVRPVLSWWRAVLVAEPAWECRADALEPTPLAAADLARVLAARCSAPDVHDLLRDEALRRHETRGLHALGAALVAPAGPGAVLYVDFREGLSLPGERELTFVACLARVLATHLPPPAPPEEPVAPFPGILGRCDAMNALYRAMAAVAPSEVTVHVYGDTGTGKEKVARALHERSRRAGGPFVAINASSYGDEMFQAELFGHRRGAFTGADRDRDGLVAAADGGTLFIDEVTDLSPVAQARLLRLIQERVYRRAGENEERKANVRIVTASNVRLEDRVAARAFRSDLMYRLKVETLTLPPVRERGGDVLILARHFLAQAARREGVATPVLSSEAGRVLVAYDWPGNVREIDNEMQRLVLRACRGPVRIEHLSKELKAPPQRGRSSLKEALRDFERAYVAEALASNGGNRARTALELGLTRQALVAKIPRLGL